jgi:hypothetical protein
VVGIPFSGGASIALTIPGNLIIGTGVVVGANGVASTIVGAKGLASLVLAASKTPKDAQKIVDKDRGPRDIERIDAPVGSVPGSQWHAHQKQVVKGKNPALNQDGSAHDGVPSFSQKTLKWLAEHGWTIP